ncbi:Plant organelle RNA recognition domain [Macleaya cordata]|uniref:Plant organelle RNA recognition domain n=1 Tax=Macleaya cordata TaxID=56857 RepID=A0A200R9E2_MACCD|nr:Plant organelle RNA recognition domain [Macleaya cordata]
MKSNYANQKPVLALEFICWTGDLAKSVMEKKARAYKKGMPLAFPLEFSGGYELEKKIKKWEGYKRDLLVQKHPLMGMSGLIVVRKTEKKRRRRRGSWMSFLVLKLRMPVMIILKMMMMMAGRCNVVVGRGRMARNSLPHTEMNQPSGSSVRDSSNGTKPNMVGDRVPTPVSRKEVSCRWRNASARTPVRSRYPRSTGRLLTGRKGTSTW